MQHITGGDKSLLLGDSATQLLMEYAALLGKIGSADTVKVNAISGDGDAVVSTFLLNAGTVMWAETSRSPAPEPENNEVEAYLRERLDSYSMTDADLLGLRDAAQEAAPDQG